MHGYNPNTAKWRQEGQEFKVILGYIAARPVGDQPRRIRVSKIFLLASWPLFYLVSR